MTSEEWRVIPGTNGRYEVSDLGRVRSYARARTTGVRIMRQAASDNGYNVVAVAMHGQRRRSWYVHRLVLLAFVGPKPEVMVTRHLDGDKQHNALTNLTYGTRAENAQDAIKHGAVPLLMRTTCARGHLWTQATTTFLAAGARRCRVCERERSARRRQYNRDHGIRILRNPYRLVHTNERASA